MGASAALIIGYTIQGLAIARALSRAGVPVYVLERGMRRRGLFRSNPLSFTEYATFLHSTNLSGLCLVNTLLECRSHISERNVVLFPTSDNTVAVLAREWEKLHDRYLLSWSGHRNEVAKVIQKGALPGICDAAGVKYPKTTVFRSEEDFGQVQATLGYPTLVKPNKPASTFKAHICHDPENLKKFLISEKENWPLVVQEWIEGPDENLFAYTSLVSEHREIFSMVSRKKRASPPGLGRASIIETADDDEVVARSRRLMKNLDLCGPVAMEFKKDLRGEYWFIEANVGRTEFCVDLAIRAGFNIPLMEFCQALNRPIPDPPTRLTPSIWYDTDKEPFCYWALCMKKCSITPFGKLQVFPYWRREGWRVIFVALVKAARQSVAHAWRKVVRVLRHVGMRRNTSSPETT